MNWISKVDVSQASEEQLSRVRRYRIPLRAMVVFFLYQKGLPDFVHFPDCNIPSDALILGTRFDDLFRVFEIFVSHPSFDLVGEGEAPPLDDSSLTWNTYELAKKADKPVLV